MRTLSNLLKSSEIIDDLLVPRKVCKVSPRTGRRSTPRFCIRLIAASIAFLGLPTSQAEQAMSRVTAIRVPGGGQVRKSQAGADGTIHLLLNGAQGPQYVNSRDRGLTFSAPIPVVNGEGQRSDLEFDGEDLAVGKDGRILVAMSNNAWKLKFILRLTGPTRDTSPCGRPRVKCISHALTSRERCCPQEKSEPLGQMACERVF
jgi:hypothetical protein